MANRSHYYNNRFSVNGAVVQVVPNAVCTLYEAGTTTPLADTIYKANSGGLTYTNGVDLIADQYGNIDFYLASPKYVKIVSTGVGVGSLESDWQHVHSDPALISNKKFEMLDVPLGPWIGIGPADYHAIGISRGNKLDLTIPGNKPKIGALFPSISIQDWQIAPNQSGTAANPEGNSYAGLHIFQGRAGTNVLTETFVASAGSDWLQITGPAPWTDNDPDFIGMGLDIVEGTGASVTFGGGAYQPREIVATTASPPRLYVDYPWDIVPDATSKFVVNQGNSLGNNGLQVFMWDDADPYFGVGYKHAAIGMQIFAKQSTKSTAKMFAALFLSDNNSPLGSCIGVEVDWGNHSTKLATLYASGAHSQQNFGLNLLASTSLGLGTNVQGIVFATGGLADGTNIADTARAWTPGQYARGYAVTVYDGANNILQYRRIIANTSNTLTLWPALPFQMTAGHKYAIFECSSFTTVGFLMQAAPFAGAYDGLMIDADFAIDRAINFSRLDLGMFDPDLMYIADSQRIFTATLGGIKKTVMELAGGMVAFGVPYAKSARAYRSSGVQIIGTGSATPIALDGESFDNASMHDNATNPSRLTAPETGIYAISGGIFYQGHATGVRDVTVRVNGGTVIATTRDSTPDATNGSIMPVTAVYSLTAGQYIEMFAFQNSGSDVNVGAGADLTWLSLTRIG